MLEGPEEFLTKNLSKRSKKHLARLKTQIINFLFC